MAYMHLWSDMHANIHHNQMDDLEKWYIQAKSVLDFWPVAYYPFYMRKNEAGASLEDLHDSADIAADWELVRTLAVKAESEGWPMFMGYEWQGSGLDGDHNVFFLGNDQPMLHPMRYQELRDAFRDVEAIAIPHHIAYQLGSRGKNWETHDERFSPVAEIYSSHGCSENDTGPFDMERHLHMGPRTGATCYERGLERGWKVGAIASGDNHKLPGVYDHGSMCVLSAGRDKRSIWEGIRARRTYGVTRSRVEIDFDIDGAPMGSVVKPGKATMRLNINAADAIDRVEILRDNVPEETLVHSGSWERQPLPDSFLMKFRVEFGWGPNPRFYPDMPVKEWRGALRVPRRLASLEKCWNSYGQSLRNVADASCEFDLTTYMSTATGHWMGPSPVTKEGFVFEVETSMDDVLELEVDGERIPLHVADMLKTSRIYPKYRESEELGKRTFGDIEHYRDDFIWHNAYKVRVRQAVPLAGYTLSAEREVDMTPGCNYRLRVWLRNGDAAWTSPIFCE